MLVQKLRNAAVPVTLALAACACSSVPPASAQPAAEVRQTATYADLADLVGSADLVVHAEIRRQSQLEAERAPGLAPGFSRLYIEGDTKALIGGTVPIGEQIKYLVDVPNLPNGKPPKLRGQSVLIFADTVPGRPGQLQLTDPRAQLLWSPQLEERVRGIVSETVQADAPPAITGIVDAISIGGNLVGESETQLFLSTADGSPASITVLRRPGQSPQWGVSFSEIVDQAAQPVARDTLAWYRLACGLPDALPADAVLSRDRAARVRAEQDYAWVRGQIGPCQRMRDTGVS